MFLSATPVRDDGLQKLLPAFVHYPPIWRKISHPFYVLRVNTEFVPTVVLDRDGNPDWRIVLQSLAENYERNVMIVIAAMECIRTGLKVLISTKYLFHVEALRNMLRLAYRLDGHTQKEAESAIVHWTSETESVDYNASAIISTVGKTNMSFNWKEATVFINALDLSSSRNSLSNPEQLYGRVMRQPDVTSFIIEFVDQHSTLIAHSTTRIRWCTTASEFKKAALIDYYINPSRKPIASGKLSKYSHRPPSEDTNPFGITLPPTGGVTIKNELVVRKKKVVLV